ncbi:MAG: protein-L-isoaspartate O-methyltransferase, partial [Mesorhizobium sp.]
MSADFAERRVKMVDGQIRTTDVTSAPLLEAMLVVPREAF